MANQLKFRRDSASDWISANSVLGAGEFGGETDTEKLKIGDGSTAWNDLQYITGDAATPLSTQAQGSTSGYTSGGGEPPGYSNIIDKFPFSSDANATDVGDLTLARRGPAGQSSSTHGYSSGGAAPPSSSPPSQPTWPNSLNKDIIDKFPFASDGNATDVGDLTREVFGAAGQSSTASGYTSGGNEAYSGGATERNTIDKFPFASDGNATDVGDITESKEYAGGQSSTTHGYTSGGNHPSEPTAYSNVIDKFSFSSDGNATDVGDLTVARTEIGGHSSKDNGYSSGGRGSNPAPPPSAANVNIIDKFPFASDANATDVGDLTVLRSQIAGQSSTANGYSSGGSIPASPYRSNVIDKFPFASDANATDVGDLTVARREAAGQQV